MKVNFIYFSLFFSLNALREIRLFISEFWIFCLYNMLKYTFKTI